MSDVFVGGRSGDMAVLLLAAAEDLGLDQAVVRTQTNPSGYLVPEEVAEAADVGDYEKPADEVPAKTAKKADWVAYAVSQGADEDEAEALTKDALIEQYHPEEE